jgi:hypothetical protein
LAGGPEAGNRWHLGRRMGKHCRIFAEVESAPGLVLVPGSWVLSGFPGSLAFRREKSQPTPRPSYANLDLQSRLRDQRLATKCCRLFNSRDTQPALAVLSQAVTPRGRTCPNPDSEWLLRARPERRWKSLRPRDAQIRFRKYSAAAFAVPEFPPPPPLRTCPEGRP